jgi:hypothetical protein
MVVEKSKALRGNRAVSSLYSIELTGRNRPERCDLVIVDSACPTQITHRRTQPELYPGERYFQNIRRLTRKSVVGNCFPPPLGLDRERYLPDGLFSNRLIVNDSS